jgi:hypothetical protein
MMTRLFRPLPAALVALAAFACLGEAPSYGYAADPAADAGEAPALPAALLPADRAGGLGGNGMFTGFATRSRVVQFCAVAMCLALFILMKKFAEPGPARPRCKCRGDREGCPHCRARLRLAAKQPDHPTT